MTILRPSWMYNTLDFSKQIHGRWQYNMVMFNRTLYRIEGQNASWQPVFVNDVSMAAINCLKMDSTVGQTFDLGGPHTYTIDEIYEQFFNTAMIKPYIVPIKME